MTDPSTECRAVEPLLRGHALGLLSEQEVRRVDAHMASCPYCRAALDAEHAALAVLDTLPDAPPPARLADRTLRRVRIAEAEKQARPRFSFRRRLAEWAVVCCVLVTVAAVILPLFSRAREAARRSSCPNNLKQLGLVLKMYANEHKGTYPPSVSVDGAWVVDLRTIYPEYLTDPDVLFCPDERGLAELESLKKALSKNPPDWDRAHHLIAGQYVYLGWVIRNDQDFQCFLTQAHPAPGTDLKIGGATLYGLREGVELSLVKDKNDSTEAAQLQGHIPVMFDNPATNPHSPKGIHVLYFNGHVDFMRLGKDFPATPAVLKHFDAESGKK